MLEVEQKYRIANPQDMLARLQICGFKLEDTQLQIDTYLRHPARDFATTGEALRLRSVAKIDNNEAVSKELLVTYKGARQRGAVKIRPEIELPLGGPLEQWLSLWSNLGFTIADTVRKFRRTFVSPLALLPSVAFDSVETLGYFVELESIVPDDADPAIATEQIELLAERLELTDIETRSYLRQILDAVGRNELTSDIPAFDWFKL